jgi:hypothetical protein
MAAAVIRNMTRRIAASARPKRLRSSASRRTSDL